MTFVKWGLAAAVALAFSPVHADDYKTDAQRKETEARQEAQKQKADAQKDASEKKAEAQKDVSQTQADAQKKMSEADREAAEKSAKADEKASEKVSDARKDAAKDESRTSDDANRTAASSTDARSSRDANKAPLSATAKETLKKLHADSEMEVSMARSAKDKAQNDKVKDLAGTIQDDHQKMMDKINDLARDRNVELSAAKGMDKSRAHAEQMNKMQGAAFDKHYADMMAQEHRKDIAELRKVQPKLHANKADEDVAKLVDDALDKLQKHEKMAVDAQTALKKDQRQGRRSGATSSDRTGASSWPNTAANGNAGADTATGPHTGADTTTDRDAPHGQTTSTTETKPSDSTHR